MSVFGVGFIQFFEPIAIECDKLLIANSRYKLISLFIKASSSPKIIYFLWLFQQTHIRVNLKEVVSTNTKDEPFISLIKQFG